MTKSQLGELSHTVSLVLKLSSASYAKVLQLVGVTQG